ncbi:MAG TPA: peptidoglycan-binding protein [Pyrinomonadaceae bacterium]|jgi:peptidoglycan L-alanyl-D-glutamate endopeptidase CwlK
MTPASENRLKKVHPELASRVRTAIANLAQGGIQVEVVQGLRTFAEQDALYAQGRTKPGQIVTRARGGQSNHNYGLAVDVVPYTDGKPNWNAPNSVWVLIGTEAEKLGLQWGGSWKKFIDRPHIQLSGLSINQCLSLFKKGGLQAVWAEASRQLNGSPSGGPAKPPAQPVKPPVKPPVTPPVERTLGLNDSGQSVRLIQTRLAALKLLSEKDIDGVYGPRTAAAVKKFQTANKLTADGRVGPKTRVALMK